MLAVLANTRGLLRWDLLPSTPDENIFFLTSPDPCNQMLKSGMMKCLSSIRLVNLLVHRV